MNEVFIRAEVVGRNISGQNHVQLYANGTDGIEFWTDPSHTYDIDDLVMERLSECVETILWYNHLEDYVAKWAELEPESNGYIIAPRDYCMDEADRYSQDWGQLQAIWMMCIRLFGDYGTSPRYGWIEKVEEFRRFCRMCTEECIKERSEAW